MLRPLYSDALPVLLPKCVCHVQAYLRNAARRVFAGTQLPLAHGDHDKDHGYINALRVRREVLSWHSRQAEGSDSTNRDLCARLREDVAQRAAGKAYKDRGDSFDQWKYRASRSRQLRRGRLAALVRRPLEYCWPPQPGASYGEDVSIRGERPDGNGETHQATVPINAIDKILVIRDNARLATCE